MVALTPNYSYNLPTVGEDLDSWGALLNANWTKADTKFKEQSDKIGVLEPKVATLETKVTALETGGLTAAQIIAMVYPIGSIYISIKNVNPGTYITGTTWVAKAQGRAIVGVGTADGTAWAVNEAKGSSNVTLTAAQMPVHAHVADPPAQAFTSGTESAGHSHAVGQNAHSHGITDVAHNHGLSWNDPGHNHGTSADQILSATDASYSTEIPTSGTGTYRVANATNSTAYTGISAGIQASGSGIYGTNNGWADIWLGGRDTAHTHATTVDLSAFWTQNTGGDGAHTNIQPSIGLYIWERTA